MGLVVMQLVGSAQTRDRTHVPCIGRWILIHCTNKEVLFLFLRGTVIFFSIVDATVYIPTNNAEGFPFLHTISSMCYL